MTLNHWQLIKEQADSSKHSQDPAELSATLKLIYRIAEAVTAGVELPAEVITNQEVNNEQ
jgi:hypothetical protein